MSAGVCAQNGGYDVNGDGIVDNEDVVCLVNKILGIADGADDSGYSYDVNNDQKVDMADVTAVIDILSDSTDSEVRVLNEGIGDWSQMWVSGEGNLMAMKYKNGTEEELDKIALLMSGKNDGKSHTALFDFNEDGTPRSILVDDNMISVRRIYDGKADVTVVLGDETIFFCDSIPLSGRGAMGRAVMRHEFFIQRPMETALEILVGAVAVKGGAVVLVGAATTLTPLMAAAGIGLIGLGAAAIYDGYKQMVSAAAEERINNNNGIGDDFYLEKAGEKIQNLDSDIFTEESSDRNAILRFWDKIVDYAEEWRVKALTAEEYMAGIDGHVFANKAKNVGEETAILSGRFSSNSYFDDSSTCVAGFAIYPAGSPKDYKLITTEGSKYFSAQVSGLTPATEYEYRAFFQDSDHKATVWSEPVSFTTLKILTGRPQLKLDKSFELNGSVYYIDESVNNARLWFVYSVENKDPHLGYSNCTSILVTGNAHDGDYSACLTDYNTDETYYYRIVLEVDGVEICGEVRTFGLNSFMGLTYELIGNVSFSNRTIITQCKARTYFRPNELQSNPCVVLMQNGKVVARYALTMEEAGNDVDLYTCDIIVGLEESDLNIDFQNYRARTKDLYIAPCYSMEVEGQLQTLVFDEQQVKFDITYEVEPEIIFTSAEVPNTPEITAGSDGKKVAITTYIYQIGVVGAFWINKATFKSKSSNSESWNLPSSVPFETLMDGYMPKCSGTIRVEYKPNELSDYLMLQSYFDITLPYGLTTQSVNHLRFLNNGYYITGVRRENGSVSASRQLTNEKSLTNGESLLHNITIESGVVSQEDVTTDIPEKWRNVPTISTLKKQAGIGGTGF